MMFCLNDATRVWIKDEIKKEESRMTVEVYEDKVEMGWRIFHQAVEISIYFVVSLLNLIGIDILKYRNSEKHWFFSFSGLESVPVRQIREYASLSKSLDMIYNYFGRFDGLRPGGLAIDWFRGSVERKIANFWVRLPIAQDVRSRLALVTEILEKKMEEIHFQKGIVKIVMLAGGTEQDVIMAISNLRKRIPDLNVEVVCVEPDHRALPRVQELIELYGLDSSRFKTIRKMIDVNQEKRHLSVILKNNGYDFSDFDIVVCIGLGDYMFDEKLVKFLRMLDNGKSIITANISGNEVERKFLHSFVRWPEMQYLTLDDYRGRLITAYGLKRKIKIIQTPQKIFNLAVID